jgi:L-fuculose-phosphate aldolase
VLVTDLQGNIIEGEGVISRESVTHYKLLNEFPDGSAVVHAHARNVLALSTILLEPMLPVVEATLKFGIVEITDYARRAHVGDNVACKLHAEKPTSANRRPQSSHAYGMFVIGKDLNAAVDAVERLNINAWLSLSSPVMPGVFANMADERPLARSGEKFGKSGY